MPLTPEQQAQLEELQREASAPPVRTTEGLKGVLHTLIDVASGNVPHLAADAWEALHLVVETYDHERQAAEPDPGEPDPGEPAE